MNAVKFIDRSSNLEHSIVALRVDAGGRPRVKRKRVNQWLAFTVLAAPICFASGDSCQLENADEVIGGRTINVAPYFAPAAEIATPKSPNVETAKFIVDAFRLSVSEFSRIIGVSRQAAHDWLNGSSVPSEENVNKLRSLELAATRLSASGITPSSQHLRRVVDFRGSLADNVKSGNDVNSLLDRILAVLVEEQNQRALISQRVSVDASEKPTDDFGIPFYDSRS